MSLNLIMGARNGASNTREENDFYATHPDATRAFLDKLAKDGIELDHNIWEPACGQGHISKVLEEYGHEVFSTDLINRGYGLGEIDFLSTDKDWYGDIMTNPPFKLATEFIRKAIDIIPQKNRVLMFVKIQFLESEERRKLFEEYPPEYVYVYSKRQQCSMNGDFENLKAKTHCYCWIIWNKRNIGDTIIRWI